MVVRLRVCTGMGDDAPIFLGKEGKNCRISCPLAA